jgi:hypothetical protein
MKTSFKGEESHEVAVTYKNFEIWFVSATISFIERPMFPRFSSGVGCKILLTPSSRFKNVIKSYSNIIML